MMSLWPSTTWTQWVFVALALIVGLARLLEMRLSKRHQRELTRAGLRVEPERAFVAMVALHTGVLVGAVLEVLFAHRAFNPIIGVPAALAFFGANGLRLWVIRTMAGHWNVRVVDSSSLGVVTAGPYAFIRHPNYVAVFAELLAFPLIHGAYVTAVVGTLAHVMVLSKRIALEDGILLASPSYKEAMGHKPRFLPRLSSTVDRQIPS